MTRDLLCCSCWNVHMAEMMSRKKWVVANDKGWRRSHSSSLGRSEMARYLFDKTREILYDDDWITLFLICVNSGLYGKHINNQTFCLSFQPSLSFVVFHLNSLLLFFHIVLWICNFSLLKYLLNIWFSCLSNWVIFIFMMAYLHANMIV